MKIRKAIPIIQIFPKLFLSQGGACFQTFIAFEPNRPGLSSNSGFPGRMPRGGMVRVNN